VHIKQVYILGFHSSFVISYVPSVCGFSLFPGIFFPATFSGKNSFGSGEYRQREGEGGALNRSRPTA